MKSESHVMNQGRISNTEITGNREDLYGTGTFWTPASNSESFSDSKDRHEKVPSKYVRPSLPRVALHPAFIRDLIDDHAVAKDVMAQFVSAGEFSPRERAQRGQNHRGLIQAATYVDALHVHVIGQANSQA
jgi:hypothetical protein